jgi:hypothetical protein
VAEIVRKLQLSQAVKKASALLVCPISRYVIEKCCSNAAQVENFNSVEYKDELIEFQDQHRRILPGWGGGGGS